MKKKNETTVVEYQEYDKKELEKLRKILLEMLDEVVRICDKHKLNYFLAGGTALGAIRHKGYIPWDDDVDVIMPREDYEKFLVYARDEISDEYFLDYYKTDKLYYKHHLTIRKNNTMFGKDRYAERTKKGVHLGFFLDVLPIDYVKSRTSKMTLITAALVRAIELAIRYKSDFLNMHGLKYKPITLPMLLLPKKVLHKWLFRVCTEYDNKKRDYLIEYCAIRHNIRQVIYDYDVVFPAKKATFCGKEYNVFNNVDQYLKQIYGDYMKLPPKEMRIAHMPLKLDFEYGLSYNTKEEYFKLNRK